MASTPPNLMANGNISPACFVKLDTGNDDYALQATAGSGSHGDPTIGISSESTDQPPLSDLITTFYHAIAGEPVRLYGAGDICSLVAGAAISTERRLKSDANGNGIPVTSDGDFIGAIALETCSGSGQKVKVQVVSPAQMAAA
ncbi:MAG TPA: hypothetical protein VG125_19670 [Pirellulales bacterium]|jgi:hypothetical protein|nr:hypothetical protein [Pirellulales bacterium]